MARLCPSLSLHVCSWNWRSCRRYSLAALAGSALGCSGAGLLKTSLYRAWAFLRTTATEQDEIRGKKNGRFWFVAAYSPGRCHQAPWPLSHCRQLPDPRVQASARPATSSKHIIRISAKVPDEFTHHNE